MALSPRSDEEWMAMQCLLADMRAGKKPVPLAPVTGSGGNEVIVRLTEDGRWAVTFCGDTQIARSGTLRFKRDGTLKLQTSHPE